MSTDLMGVSSPPTTRPAEIDTPETWGTASRFRRLSRVDARTASYWLDTVYRPAHRISHQFLNIAGCPGCTFERAVES